MARADSALPHTANISLLDVIQGLVLPNRDPLDQMEGGENVYLGIRMQVVSLWARSDFAKGEKTKCRYRLKAPGGKEVTDIAEQQIVFSIDLESQINATARLNMAVFPVRGLGTYYWVTELHEPAKGKRKRAKWREVSRIPLPMTVLEPTAGSPR